MNVLKTGYILRMIAVVAIILAAGSYQLPMYTGRLLFLAVLALIDMRYWFSVRKHFARRFKTVLSTLYWLPLCMLLVFFIAGVIVPLFEWNSFLRIYFPGVLLILLIGKGIFLGIIIVSDIFIIPLNAIRQVNPENIEKSGRWYRPRSFMLLAAGISSLVMLLSFSGMIFWVRDFKVDTVEIPIKNLPKSFDGYRIVQVSDLHLGGFLNTSPVKEITRIVNAQHADLIVFTGDLVSFITDEALPFEDELKKFTAKDGVYAILGNHDYGDYTRWPTPEDKALNNEELYDFYNRIGWHLLRNQNTVIYRDTSSIALLGVENWSVNKRFGKKGDVNRALIGTKGTSYQILLTHDPSHWDAEVRTRFPQIGLTLSGHTHAFQFAIENNCIKWSPASLVFKEWGGLYTEKKLSGRNQYLYVNRGAGTLGYPGRIFSRPEITLLILRRAQ